MRDLPERTALAQALDGVSGDAFVAHREGAQLDGLTLGEELAEIAAVESARSVRTGHDVREARVLDRLPQHPLGEARAQLRRRHAGLLESGVQRSLAADLGGDGSQPALHLGLVRREPEALRLGVHQDTVDGGAQCPAGAVSCTDKTRLGAGQVDVALPDLGPVHTRNERIRRRARGYAPPSTGAGAGTARGRESSRRETECKDDDKPDGQGPHGSETGCGHETCGAAGAAPRVRPGHLRRRP